MVRLRRRQQTAMNRLGAKLQMAPSGSHESVQICGGRFAAFRSMERTTACTPVLVSDNTKAKVTILINSIIAYDDMVAAAIVYDSMELLTDSSIPRLRLLRVEMESSDSHRRKWRGQ